MIDEGSQFHRIVLSREFSRLQELINSTNWSIN
jgi:hypothetical protein